MAMEEKSDETLINDTVAGNQRAYEALVLRYQDAVARFVWRLVRQPEDREEVCQDIFVKAYLNLAKFNFDAKFSTWLYSIAYRTAISSLRRKHHDIDGEVDIDQMEGLSATQEEAEDDEIARLLKREISGLGLEDRSVVTLYHVQGCGIDEISLIMGMPAGTIKSNLYRVRKKLKDKISPLLALAEGFEEAIR